MCLAMPSSSCGAVIYYIVYVLAYRIRSSCCYGLEVRATSSYEKTAQNVIPAIVLDVFFLMLMYWPLSGRRNDNGAEIHNRAELRTITMIKISRVSMMSGCIGHAIFRFLDLKLLNSMGNFVHIQDGQMSCDL